VVADAELPIRFVAAGVGRLPTVARWDLVGTSGGTALLEAVRGLSPEAMATIAFHAPAYVGAVSRGPLAPTAWTRPVPGAKVLLLDHGQLVAPGMVGDVYIGGRAMGAEFAGGRNRQRFVSDPYEPRALVSDGPPRLVDLRGTADHRIVSRAVCVVMCGLPSRRRIR
jgi:hypothetical protein